MRPLRSRMRGHRLAGVFAEAAQLRERDGVERARR